METPISGDTAQTNPPPNPPPTSPPPAAPAATASPPAPAVRSSDYWNRYWAVWLLLVLWAILLITFVVWGANRKAPAATLPTACNAIDPDKPPAQNPTNPAVLKPHTSAISGVPFGRGFGVQQRNIEYDATSNSDLLKDARSLAVETALFQTTAGDRQLDPDDIVAWAEVKSQNRVFLHVCFQRDNSMGAAGIYTGTVSITDPRVARVDVPFNVSLNYPVWQLVIALWILMLLPASLYVWLLLGSFTDTRLTIANFKTWIFSRNAIIALGTGGTVSFGFVLATYFKGEAWGVSVTEATALFGGAFAGFVAAAAGVTSAGQDRQPRTMTEGSS
jgi:hypothetical protein